MSENCCCDKKTIRDIEDKKKLINRLKRIEGQIRGIETMLEQDKYCVDVLTQAQAACSALNSFSRELLSAHIKGCVIRDIKDGKEDVADELIDTIQKFMK